MNSSTNPNPIGTEADATTAQTDPNADALARWDAMLRAGADEADPFDPSTSTPTAPPAQQQTDALDLDNLFGCAAPPALPPLPHDVPHGDDDDADPDPPDLAAAADYLRWVHPADQTWVNVAAKVPTPNGPRFDSHSFSTITEAIAAVAKCIEADALAVWATVHQPRGELGHRKPKIEQMAAWQFLCIDIDNAPAIKGTCASADERQTVGAVADRIIADLTGLRTPAHIDTGNGRLLLYPIELPSTPQNKDIMRRLASSLTMTYRTPGADIDTDVIQDQSRILGIVGTVNANKEQRPEMGRIARRRRIIGKLPTRTPTTAPDFIAWAEAYIAAHPCTDPTDGRADDLDTFDLITTPSTSTRQKITPAPDAPTTNRITAPPSTDALDRLRKVAISYMAKCDPAIEGDGGDRQTFRIAGHLAALRFERADGPALSEADILDLMGQHYNPRCSPPWADADLRSKVASALHNGSARQPKIVLARGAVNLDGWIAADSDLSSTHDVHHGDDGQHVPQQTTRPDLTIDLADYPPLLREAVAALHIANPVMPVGCIVTPALAIGGLLIGKRMVATNHGQKYYPNVWTVPLAPTATNKSGTRNLIQSALADTCLLLPNKPTSQSLYAELGRIIDKRTWAGLSMADRRDHKEQFRRECEGDASGRMFLSDECTGMLKRLMGSWDAKRAGADLDDVLNLSDPTYRHESPTVGDGYRMMYDLAITFVGFSQPETWEREMGTDALRDAGLFGRFIPTTTAVKIIGAPADARPLAQVVGQMRQMADDLDDLRMAAEFGVSDRTDFIKEQMDALDLSPVMTYMRRVYPADAQRLRGKIIMHAIKMAMVCAFFDGRCAADDGFNRARQPVDCRSYFRPCADAVAKWFVGYLDAADDPTVESGKESALLSRLRRHGYLIKEDASKAARLYGSQFDSFMTGLISSGRVGVIRRDADPDGHAKIIATMGKGPRCKSPIFYAIS